jgi:hypothetical protein
MQQFTHLSFTFPLSADWCSVSALRDIGHAICSRESLMMMSHAKCGTGGSDTRSERCSRPRLRAMVRPLSLGAHPSMITITFTETQINTTHDLNAQCLWRYQSRCSHDTKWFDVWCLIISHINLDVRIYKFKFCFESINILFLALWTECILNF